LAELPTCSPQGSPVNADPPPGITTVFVDEHLIALDKPAGLLAVPGRGADKADCLSARVQVDYPDALIVHRLDQATSGLLLMPRSLAMQRSLSRAFEQRKVHKHYIAVAAGRLGSAPGDAGEIDLPLMADWPRRPKQKVDHPSGKPALTRWRVLAHEDIAGIPVTRLELLPVTGRTHQLRVHLAAIGHPLLGDALYAPPEVCGASPRLLLHAEQLRLSHPASGVDLELKAPAPF
jgi:tRNA pseudouridine32 synthase/23S rRNA pseudouridine746 synthase